MISHVLSAYLYRGETPIALADLKPTTVKEIEPISGLEDTDGKRLLYSSVELLEKLSFTAG
jgi:hypothetical protein